MIKIPLRFDTKKDYIEKMIELIKVEAECEKIDTEMIALPNVPFRFEERYEIYSMLRFNIPIEY